MADNITLNSGSGGDVVAADDIGGVKYQRVKVNFGVDGAATDVSSSNPLPVTVSGLTATLDTGSTLNVSITTGDTVPVSVQSMPTTTVNGSVSITTGDSVPVIVQSVPTTTVNGSVSITTGDTVPVAVKSMPTTTVNGTVTVNSGNTLPVSIVTGDTVPTSLKNSFVSTAYLSVDTNSSGTVTSALDIGGLSNVAVASTPESGNHANYVVVLQYSLDNTNWWDSDVSLINGSGSTQGNIYGRYIRAKVSVAEGSTSVSTIRVIAK